MPNLLDNFGIEYDQLNPAEKETLQEWQKALEKNQITLKDVKGYVSNLIEAVQKELADIREATSFWTYLFGWKKDFYIKARLKNYLMLHDFLTGPEKARKYIEQSLSQIK
jgi:hypothetical protein